MQSAQNNRERVNRELERLDGRLRLFVVRQMRSLYGASWQQEAQKSLRHPRWREGGDLHLDTSALLYILRNQWERIFHQRLRPAEREMIRELLRIRNKWAHQEAFTDTEVERLLKNVEHVLTWIDPTDSSSRPTFKQTNTTRSNPTPVRQTPPDWQELQISPFPARTSFVSRRTILLLALAGAGGVSIFLCGQSQREQNTTQPDQTVTGQQPTTTPQSQPLFTYKGHSDRVEAVAWSPDGRRIASGSGDLDFTGDNTVQVWNASDGSHLFTYTGHSGEVEAVAWSPDGKRIASGSSDNTVQAWDASDGNHALTYTGHSAGVWSVAWSPDGKRIVSCGNDGVQVWNASSGSHAFAYQGHSGWVDAVAWSHDGKWIASGSWDNTVQVWNASDGTHVFTYTGHSNVVDAVAWSPDGKRMASGSWDWTAQVWNA